jgi:hypothetical protein
VITLSLFYIFQGKLDDAYNAPSNPNPDPYHLLSTYCSFDFARFFNLKMPQSLAVFIEGKNLLNRPVYMPDWGGVDTETIPVNPGMTLFVGLSGSFVYNTN